MNTDIAIEVKNISKSFKIYYDKGNTLKELSIFGNRRKYENRKVINDISFTVNKGEAIGLVGRNGCGKSTTLKLLTRIMYPDTGSIEINGRVSSLIELGAGFHPDMSGRENIYINASIFGLTKKEIDERLEDIISFSELRDFIDNPVRTYSSGMYMRLAFSVAINVDADILLIDEILAVGDVKFQSKCFNKLREIKAKGTTIVIVSHNLGQIEDICDKSYWIDEGKIREEGLPRTVHRKYLEYMSNFSMSNDKKPAAKNSSQTTATQAINPLTVKENNDTNTEKQIIIKNCLLLDKNGNAKNDFITGEEADFIFEYEVLDPNCGEASIELAIYRTDNLECYETNTFREGYSLMKLEGKGKIRYHFNKLNLITGGYYIEVGIRKKDGFPFDYREKACRLVMTSLDRERGIAKLDHKWVFEEK